MGIPKLYSRIRAYGTTNEIGRARTTSQESQSQSHRIAIVDGPSLAHFLFEQLPEEDSTDMTIGCLADYAKLGQKAIAWLDNLRSVGFEIERIYFDGALPAAKRDTRLARLQKHTNNIAKYKRTSRYVSDVYSATYDPTLTHCYRSTKALDEMAVFRALRQLPPPPFLVAAIVEALLNSAYSQKTAVVAGEADSYCAAAASEISKRFCQSNIPHDIIIFTNDSDLIIWGMGPNVTIGMIRDMKLRQLPAVMEILCFSPRLLARLGDHQLGDLIKPAYRMQDPGVTFTQAIKDTGVDENSDEFIRFAAQYDIAYAIEKLKFQEEMKNSACISLPPDPRIAELVNHYLWALIQLVENKQQEAEVKPSRKRKKAKTHEASGVDEEAQRAFREARSQQEPVSPLDFGESKQQTRVDSPFERQPSIRLQMFLPALIDDPAKSAAWRVGSNLRETAYQLLMLPFGDHDSLVSEYKRSGGNIVHRQVHKTPTQELKDATTGYLDYIRSALHVSAALNVLRQFKFVVMQLTLSDLRQDGKDLPSWEEILNVINNNAASDWNMLHFFARYQAEFYSMRMLKQIITFCLGREEFKQLGLPNSLFELRDKLETLPNIAQFFGTEDADIDGGTWDRLCNTFEADQVGQEDLQ